MHDFIIEQYKNLTMNESERIVAHIEELFEIALAMFRYDYPDIDFRMAEMRFCSEGVAGFQKINDKIEVGQFVGNGILGTDGLPTGGHIICANGVQGPETLKGDNLVVAYNNIQHTPDYDLFRYASLLNEVDISMIYNVIYSRLVPMPVAKTSKQKNTIDKCIDNILNGKIKTIVDDDLLRELVDASGNQISTLNLTENDKVRNLQYLSKFYDDIIRRVCTRYGQPMQTSGKMAQQSVEEIQGYASYSQILVSDKKRCREQMCKDLKEVFNIDVTVDFTIPFKVNEYTEAEASGEVEIEKEAPETEGADNE